MQETPTQTSDGLTEKQTQKRIAAGHHKNDPDTVVTEKNSGMSDADYAALLAHIERRKNNPGYFERWDEQVAEYRQQVQEQAISRETEDVCAAIRLAS